MIVSTSPYGVMVVLGDQSRLPPCTEADYKLFLRVLFLVLQKFLHFGLKHQSTLFFVRELLGCEEDRVLHLQESSGRWYNGEEKAA